MSNVYDMVNGVFVEDSKPVPVVTWGAVDSPLVGVSLQPAIREARTAYRMPPELAEVPVALFLASHE